MKRMVKVWRATVSAADDGERRRDGGSPYGGSPYVGTPCGGDYGEPPSRRRITPFRSIEFPEAIAEAEGKFFSRFAETSVSRHNLPHWGQVRSIVFVTFRLADSMPVSLLEQWRAEREQWLAAHPEPWDDATCQWYSQAFPMRMEYWLDAGHGDCILARDDCRVIVAEAIEYFNGTRYRLHAYVIMPNHVHVLMELDAYDDLPKILHSWKSFTAKAINRKLGGVGTVWQRDYFDRIVRSDAHYRHCLDYLKKNVEQANRIYFGAVESRCNGGEVDGIAAGTAALHREAMHEAAIEAAAETAALHTAALNTAALHTEVIHDLW